jgi:hypothetical protein
MPTSINKFVPIASVLAVAIYWSWPALKTVFPNAAAAVSKVESKKPEAQAFSAAVLTPTFLPFPKRNPFLSAEHKPKKSGAGRLGTTGKKSDAVANSAASSRSSLVLNATCIIGRQRMAVINGRVYKEKDAIPQAGEQAPSCFVTAIFPHKVLLACQGETVQLEYTNAKVAAKPAATNNPQKPAK